MTITVITKEKTPGDYQDTLNSLKDEGIIVKKGFLSTLFLGHRTVKTQEKLEYGLRYFLHEDQKKVLELFSMNDFDKILELPVGPFGRCSTQLSLRYTNSGSVIAVQVVEARPHEDGRYVGITPTKIFLDSDGEKIIETIKKLNQPDED